MFTKIKKMLFLIPCMVIGLFLFGNISVSAADAVLVDAPKVIVGATKLENTYYFTDEETLIWDFKANYSLVKNWDTSLKYRVTNPDGKTTAWSDMIDYVDHEGKFSINISTLSFINNDDQVRDSVAPASTYYVDITYYARFLFFKWDQDKGETIKIVVNNARPAVEVVDNGGTYNIFASILKDTKGAGIITGVYYFFSPTVADVNTNVKFASAMATSTVKEEKTITPAASIKTNIEKQDSTYKYLYILVQSGSGNSTIIEYNIESSTSDESTIPTTNETAKLGIGDYTIGQVLLLVLVVVLILSCVLIIAQKIVDYKKRLY